MRTGLCVLFSLPRRNPLGRSFYSLERLFRSKRKIVTGGRSRRPFVGDGAPRGGRLRRRRKGVAAVPHLPPPSRGGSPHPLCSYKCRIPSKIKKFRATNPSRTLQIFRFRPQSPVFTPLNHTSSLPLTILADAYCARWSTSWPR